MFGLVFESPQNIPRIMEKLTRTKIHFLREFIMENVISFIRKFSVLIEQFINVIIRVLFILFALQNSVDFLLLDVF